MRNWIIGCGAFLIIVVGLVLFLGNYLYKQAKEISGKLEKVNAEYLALETTYPFEKPEDGILTANALDRFVRCRREMLPALEEWTAKIEDEERSRIEKLSLTFDLYPSLGLCHVEALKSVAMSPSEYLWILTQVLVTLRYAESDEAPLELKSLRGALDNLAARLETREDTSEREATNQEMSPLLPQVDPEQLNLPEETVQAIAASRTGLEETLDLFYYFDIQFKATFPLIVPKPREQAPKEASPTK